MSSSFLPTPAGIYDWRVKKILSQLSVEKHRSVTLQSACTSVRISSRHLGALFKRDTGLTFHKFARTRRIQRAMELLNNPNVLIKEVGGHLGYSSPGHFTRDFRSIVGMSPSVFRKGALLQQQSHLSGSCRSD